MHTQRRMKEKSRWGRRGGRDYDNDDDDDDLKVHIRRLDRYDSKADPRPISDNLMN